MYKKPEVLEVGSTQEVILGWKDGVFLEADGRPRIVNPLTDFDEYLNVESSNRPKY